MFKMDVADASAKFVWFSKTAKRNNGHCCLKNCDISISRWNKSPKETPAEKKVYRYGITVRNEAIKALGDYVDVSVYKNRVFFKPCAEGEGYKTSVSSKSGCPNRYFSIGRTAYTYELEDFIGDYELKYDRFYELYYVEKDEDGDNK